MNEKKDDSEPLDLLEIDIEKISSAALARLVEEVRNAGAATIRVYDRIYNRHNRS